MLYPLCFDGKLLPNLWYPGRERRKKNHFGGLYRFTVFPNYLHRRQHVSNST